MNADQLMTYTLALENYRMLNGISELTLLEKCFYYSSIKLLVEIDAIFNLLPKDTQKTIIFLKKQYDIGEKQ